MFHISADRLGATLAALVLGLCVAAPATAQTPPAAQVSREIGQLFTALRQSGCEFSRNGTWYSADDAGNHLQRKYDYLVKKNLAPTTELFIERAATQSSASGKPYQVRCGQAPAVPSKAWFTDQLKALRSAAPGAWLAPPYAKPPHARA